MATFNPKTLSALGAAAGALLLSAPTSAMAQDCPADEWPCDTIEIVSHASAGGGTDTTIRMWLDAADEMIDEDMRVVYKQGGGSRAAHEYAMNRGPDGHTIIALTQTHLYTIARGNSPLTIDGIQGVARAMDDPSVIVVNADSDYEGYEDFVSAAQEGMTWGVAQVGGTEHIGISRWGEEAGVEPRVVPFGSGGDMITSLRSGAVDATLANVSEALTLIEEGEIKPIALLYNERVDDLPDVPTAAEFGHDVSVTTTRGYYVLADTDPAIVEKMEALILEAMQSERFQDYLRSSGLDPETNIGGAEEWDQQLKEEYEVSLQALRNLDMTDQ
ncbi:MAG: tripartite tricarboxylate transporter substrate binding protein [Paracoccaceae bacterium]|jgi:putative tricarboxylic transport membrane protein|nr:tripartite tricarboxylate transporter substrate binding protein [Paracoccaceae bacterium]